ncbi:outer membrane beta-barrel protein [Dyadobacter endophyticus]|uniref:outer membrane beta-barrel protein n=1 Tax=Dyadobacter endophyticus TaxID=1749036 RepID=UPI003CE7D4A7
MMDPSNINNFEEQWRKALKEASEAPPPSVWEGIEARLDGEQEKVTPLWWQSPKMWYAAASIAALLLVGGGLWYSGGQKDKVEVAVSTKPVQKAETEPAKSVEEQPNAVQGQDKEELAATVEQGPIAATGSEPTRSDLKGGIAGNSNTGIAAAARTNARGKQNEQHADNISSAASIIQERPASNNQDVIASKTEPANGSVEVSVENSNAAVAAVQNQATSAEMLASLPYNDLDVYVQKRHVFFRPEVRIEEPVKTTKPKEYYAGIGIMPASFNPNVKLREAPQAFMAQSVSQKRSVSGTSEARASYAVQTQGGVRLSKHWSVETGVSYLRGNSAYEGGGYVLNAYNSAASNVLENALAANNPALSDKAAGFNNGALYIDVAKKVSNNYQYLQLPVQAGFTLNPDKKFSYSVLGGMMANFFLVNELESASGDIIRTTASDEIYRGTNWAATTGLRLNYKLSANWGANLTGSYQKAVSSSFKSNQSLDSRPYLYGVSWSVRYSF